MFSTLQAELARRGLTQRNLADALRVSESTVSNCLKGRQEFSSAQRMAVARFVGLPEAQLFGNGSAQASRMQTPLNQLFRAVDELLGGQGNPAFLMAKFARLEPRESYIAALEHCFSIWRRQREIPPKLGFMHFVVHWDAELNGFLIETAGPSRRADSDSLQEQGCAEIHPLADMSWPPARENTANFPQGERR